MKAQRKVLVEELIQTLAPHLVGLVREDQKLGKALTSAIQQLAEQLLRARAKQRKQAFQAHLSTLPAVQQRLTDTLTLALHTELARGDYSDKKARHAIADSAEHLAHRLAKLRHKHASSARQSSAPTPEAPSPEAAEPRVTATLPDKQSKLRVRRPPPPTGESPVELTDDEL